MLGKSRRSPAMPFPPDSPRLPNPPSTLPLRGVTVLAVEDSRYSCDALRLILTRAGARLRRAETLAAARSHLACYRPEVVIVDLGLPDGRGEDLIAEAAALGLPVLGTSGEPAGRGAALAAGALGFMDKPIPSVTGFLRLIRQLATGSGPEDKAVDLALPPADPMALHDDLARAAELFAGDPVYVATFVQSLARSAGDPVLEAATRDTATDSGRATLARLIEDRLSHLGAVT
jgi:DNA-binding NarL/FixJ family response regulator